MRLEEFKNVVEEYMDFKDYFNILSSLKRTIRVNRLKISLKNFLDFTSLPLEKNKHLPFVFNLSPDFKIGRTLEYFLGYIHTQTLSSIIPPLALSPTPHSKVLDLTAAPGGKTTLMADLMKNTGCILANDIKTERIKMLVANIRRLGVINTVITRQDGREIKYKDEFDFVLLDAPCSSLGSSLSAYKIWKPKRSRDMARVQRKLLLKAFDSLKKGGYLVYSTCTFIKKENEEVVKYLLENRENAKISPIELNLPHDKGFRDYGKEFALTWRIYPHHLESEAFYIAKILKT